MTMFLVVWLRKYDQNQDFDADDENMLKKSDQVISFLLSVVKREFNTIKYFGTALF